MRASFSTRIVRPALKIWISNELWINNSKLHAGYWTDRFIRWSPTSSGIIAYRALKISVVFWVIAVVSDLLIHTVLVQAKIL